MPVLLQVDFKSEGPFGQEMSEAYADLAKSINGEPGFLWKIWTENEETQEAGGIYLFDTRQHAEDYLTMHTARLESFGITGIRGRIFDVNGPLTEMTSGPVK
ncbi:Putative monooxygenase ydhR [Bhargavaea cecembensis DSE10]|uniref:Putative monooxygenase ydhR n=1 Tax=Bhargavaea cecembensis DSE10 TaxID=1235279 RepID=M7NJ78_9BACL|nr:monooxygenase [Bhargavaea cecembensis]EMR07201.1 Putative monooxygenase ydhR [Bhargavaea cecembensis DSE10]